MKLELKRLAPYLPYKLKIGCGATYNGEAQGFTLTYDKYPKPHEINLHQFLNLNREDYRSIKPILRPLSDLTKEIEHNGDRFVPLGRLHYKSYKIRGSKAKAEYEITHREKPGIRFVSTKKEPGSHLGIDIYLERINDSPYWVVRNLFEWHFDVFGLIEKGLAIDINNLES